MPTGPPFSAFTVLARTFTPIPPPRTLCSAQTAKLPETIVQPKASGVRPRASPSVTFLFSVLLFLPGAAALESVGRALSEAPGVPSDIGCYLGNGASYEGGATLTVSGQVCQAWASTTPHSHGYTYLPENHCRNPDGEPGPWCYTTDPSRRWELCDVPLCAPPAPPPAPPCTDQDGTATDTYMGGCSVGRRLEALFNGQAWTLNSGSPNGSTTFTVAFGQLTAALAFGDVDADGDLDLIIANTNRPNELWINNGAGVFNSRSTFDGGGSAATATVAFGDVNGDGALDVVFGNTNNQANTLLLNDGSGVFRPAASFPGGSASTRAVAFGYIDGDGELDLLTGNGGANGGVNKLLMLTHCPDGGAQLHAGSSCFACPPSMGKSSPSVCLECVPDFVSEGTDGTLGPGCRKACVLAQRPLGSDSCQECKSVPGNVCARLTLT